MRWFEAMIKCSECGYENMDGLDYCDGCGAKLEAAPTTAEPTAAPSPGTSAAASSSTTEPAAVSAQPASTPAEGNAGGAAAAAEAAPESSSQAAVAPEAAAKAPTGEMNAAATPSPAAAADTAGAPFKAKLSVIRGGRRGQEFELESGNNLVGRWDPETGSFPEVDLDADDPEAKISRKHALIRLEGGKITIEDIGSLNGTYVNRQPRLQPGNPLDLKDGDEIIIGKTFLKLSINPIS
jgi:hypothetical protein